MVTLFASAQIELRFFVHGTPAAAGSKRAVPTARGPRVIDASRKAGPWKQEIAGASAAALYDLWGGEPEPVTGPLELDLTFYLRRPVGHYGSGRNRHQLKPSAPAYPAGRPDALKLARAVEDAMTGIVWRDDAQIVTEILRKRYADTHPEGVDVVVREASP